MTGLLRSVTSSARKLALLVFERDRSGLGDRRLHDRSGHLGLPPGADRRRDEPGRFRHRRAASAAASPRSCSPMARPPRTRLWSRRSARSVGGALVAVTLESFALGLGERVIRSRHLHLADGAGGAALVACIALGVVWVFGAVALHAPGTPSLRADVQRSVILRSLNSVMPPSGPVLNALDRVDPAPSIVGPGDPARESRPVDRNGPRRASRRRVGGASPRAPPADSGSRGPAGSRARGWSSPTPTSSPARTTPASRPAPALRWRRPWSTTTRKTTSRSCASAPRCRASNWRPRASGGQHAAILGYPENGPYAVAPALFGETRDVVSEDSYGNGPLRRSIASLRGDVVSGNSGGPLVDSRGRVLGTIFATTTYGPPAASRFRTTIVAEALQTPKPRSDTGPLHRLSGGGLHF